MDKSLKTLCTFDVFPRVNVINVVFMVDKLPLLLRVIVPKGLLTMIVAKFLSKRIIITANNISLNNYNKSN